MAQQAQPIPDTPPAELERAAKLAAQQGTAVQVYANGVRLTIRPDVERPAAVAADAEPPPAPHKKPPKRRRTGALTLNDPFWSIEGIVQETGTENVSGNVDRYLLEAYADDHV